MSLTTIAILLMLMGFLCVVVGFMMGGKKHERRADAKTGRTIRKRSGTTPNRKAA